MTEGGHRLAAMCTTENIFSTEAEHEYFYIMRYLMLAEKEAVTYSPGGL